MILVRKFSYIYALVHVAGFLMFFHPPKFMRANRKTKKSKKIVELAKYRKSTIGTVPPK